MNRVNRREHTPGRPTRAASIGCIVWARSPFVGVEDLGRGEGDARQIRRGLAVLESVSDDTEGEGLRVRQCLVAQGSVREYSGQLGDFREPAAVRFLFYLDSENHVLAPAANLLRSTRIARLIDSVGPGLPQSSRIQAATSTVA